MNRFDVTRFDELIRMAENDGYEKGHTIGYREAKLKYCAPGAKDGATTPAFPKPVRVIVNIPATIIFWSDGTKTVVKCQKGEKFDGAKGIAYAICKKAIGNNRAFHDMLETCYKIAEVYIAHDTQDWR